MYRIRFQPLRIKQSQVGGAFRNEQTTAWLNRQAHILFKKDPHVHMTQNYNEYNQLTEHIQSKL